MKFQYNDGGRAASGRKGSTGDCVCRSVAIASGRPYAEVYDRLALGNATQITSAKDKRIMRRKPNGKKAKKHKIATASHGINIKRKWFKDYMRSLGFTWVPTMEIGGGCRVHLHDGELPMGRLVVQVSKHFVAVIDRVINDTWDPQREVHNARPATESERRYLDRGDLTPLNYGEQYNRANNMITSVSRRCVYGYWYLIKGGNS